MWVNMRWAIKGLVTNYGEGGATKKDGGHVKFYPYEKAGGGGVRKSLSHAEGGHTTFWGSLYTVA